jgi:hypothetical protein
LKRGHINELDRWTELILGIGAVVGIIMLFAQVKLFSIASSLKDISNA